MPFPVSSDTLQQRGTAPHLSILLVNKDIPSAVVLQIGYLQAVGHADFCWLEGGIQSIDPHYCFGLSGLQKGKTFIGFKDAEVYHIYQWDIIVLPL